MRRISYFPFFLLIILTIIFLNFPLSFTNRARSSCISYVHPTYQWAGFFRSYLLKAPTLSGYTNVTKNDKDLDLQIENQNLRSQLNAVYEWLLFDGRIEEQTERLHALNRKNEIGGEIYWREFFQRRSEELKDLIEMKIQAIPAKVIYREPVSWSSSLWIDVGESDNETLGRQIISEDSPVVVGNSLVGVIEFVGQKKSRVRLITDSGLIPSVRAIRGKTQDRELAELLDATLMRVKARGDAGLSDGLESLEHLRAQLMISTEDLRLAKGELHGSSEPIWRVRSQVLKGVGFNYDYADLEGPARDLKTGSPIDKRAKGVPILKKGDLLITTGMDGVFPPGLNVATVTKIKDFLDGAYAYELEAVPTAPNIHELTSVFVIPKVGAL